MQKAGVYLHIPYCKQRCGYCSFVSSTDFSSLETYVSRLVCEITAFAHRVNADTLYIGGGTPSCLSADALIRIVQAVRGSFSMDENSEITVECNPDSADTAFFSACRRAGVTRISMGLQDASDEVLACAGRLHDRQGFLSAVQRARDAGFTNISTDLIVGLPHQTMQHIHDSLALVTALALPHISVYGLKLEESCALAAGFTADEDLQADMYEAAAEYLKCAGYLRYEVSNFALPGHESRHNMKYWQQVPYYGFGVAAHSFDGVRRYENTEDIAAYIAGKTVTNETVIDAEERRQEYIMLRLRTADGIDTADYRRRFSRELLREKADEIGFLVQNGLITADNGCVRVTDRGFYLLNSIILKLV